MVLLSERKIERYTKHIEKRRMEGCSHQGQILDKPNGNMSPGLPPWACGGMCPTDKYTFIYAQPSCNSEWSVP